MLSWLRGLLPLLVVAVCLLAPMSYICHRIGVPWYVRFLLVIGLWFISLCALPRQLPTYTGPEEDEDTTGKPIGCFNPDGLCPCARRNRVVSQGDYEAVRRRMFSYAPFAAERDSQQFYRRHRDERQAGVEVTKPEDGPTSDASARVVSFNCVTCGKPTTVDGTDGSFACEHCNAKHFPSDEPTILSSAHDVDAGNVSCDYSRGPVSLDLPQLGEPYPLPRSSSDPIDEIPF